MKRSYHTISLLRLPGDELPLVLSESYAPHGSRSYSPHHMTPMIFPIYCLAHSSDHFSLSIRIRRDDDISLVETLVKGLEDHCTSTAPSVEHLTVKLGTESEEILNKTMFWLILCLQLKL